MFRSNRYYDNEIQESHDFVVKTVVQSTMTMEEDEYQIYMWTQIEGSIIRSKLLKNFNEFENEEFDSDNVITEQDVIDHIII